MRTKIIASLIVLFTSLFFLGCGANHVEQSEIEDEDNNSIKVSISSDLECLMTTSEPSCIEFELAGKDNWFLFLGMNKLI